MRHDRYYDCRTIEVSIVNPQADMPWAYWAHKFFCGTQELIFKDIELNPGFSMNSFSNCIARDTHFCISELLFCRVMLWTYFIVIYPEDAASWNAQIDYNFDFLDYLHMHISLKLFIIYFILIIVQAQESHGSSPTIRFLLLKCAKLNWSPQMAHSKRIYHTRNSRN